MMPDRDCRRIDIAQRVDDFPRDEVDFPDGADGTIPFVGENSVGPAAARELFRTFAANRSG